VQRAANHLKRVLSRIIFDRQKVWGDGAELESEEEDKEGLLVNEKGKKS